MKSVKTFFVTILLHGSDHAKTVAGQVARVARHRGKRCPQRVGKVIVTMPSDCPEPHWTGQKAFARCDEFFWPIPVRMSKDYNCESGKRRSRNSGLVLGKRPDKRMIFSNRRRVGRVTPVRAARNCDVNRRAEGLPSLPQLEFEFYRRRAT